MAPIEATSVVVCRRNAVDTAEVISAVGPLEVISKAVEVTSKAASKEEARAEAQIWALMEVKIIKMSTMTNKNERLV